jgi:hypothetical protein
MHTRDIKNPALNPDMKFPLRLASWRLTHAHVLGAKMRRAIDGGFGKSMSSYVTDTRM